MARTLKRICSDCGAKAIINKTDRIQDGFHKMYIYCSNTCCNKVWVETVEFSHIVKHSQLKKEESLVSLIDSLSQEQKEQLKILLN
ncbi:transcriptional regulator [Phocoenobacter atlanticus]|uniref:transcriptional regulator n=1 Tax=Phocoenobacter atlanticus TaxID=3416742 RepID=UPI00277027F9|nr:transcriptional regulator [Pasteurella atlantica]MDP8101465.1 transcriptional regulator [Pasteurella atlantica]